MAQDEGAAGLPRVIASELPLPNGQDAVVLQFSVERPASCAVALVFDLSDSCPALKPLVERLIKLLEPLPREWPLWFYRLSSVTPLDDTQTILLGDLLDFGVRYQDWLDNSRLREQCRWAGSFLRPVLEAIDARREDEDLEHATTIVLTDGELLDLEPIDLPASIRLIGIGPSNEVLSLSHWNRVVPGARLHALDDRGVDVAVQPDSQAFYGWCEISWRWTDGRSVDVTLIDTEASGTTPVSGTILKCQLSERPNCLLFPVSRSDLQFLRLSVVRLETRRQAVLRSVAFRPLNPRLTQAIAPIGQDAGAAAVQIVADLQADDSRFPAVWQAYIKAADLADAHQRWLGGDGKMLVFGAEVFEGMCADAQGRSLHDAILVLGNREPGSAYNDETRIVLIGLDRKRQPALTFNPDQPLPFGTPVMPAQISYEKREKCWMLQQDTERRELELDGSERLRQPLLKTGDLSWLAFFSGDLR